MKITFISGQDFTIQLEEKLRDNTDNWLDLSGNPLGKRGKDELQQLIKLLIPSKITQVNLSQTGLQLKTGVLAEILSEFKNTSVVNINLSGNWLGTKKSNDELKQIAQTLVNAGIEEIDLSSNQLGKVEQGILEDFFKILNHPKLARVYLNGNQFDNLGGAPFVADFLFRLLGSKAVLTDSDSFSQLVQARMALLNEANSTETNTLVFH